MDTGDTQGVGLRGGGFGRETHLGHCNWVTLLHKFSVQVLIEFKYRGVKHGVLHSSRHGYDNYRLIFKTVSQHLGFWFLTNSSEPNLAQQQYSSNFVKCKLSFIKIYISTCAAKLNLAPGIQQILLDENLEFFRDIILNSNLKIQ